MEIVDEAAFPPFRGPRRQALVICLQVWACKCKDKCKVVVLLS